MWSNPPGETMSTRRRALWALVLLLAATMAPSREPSTAGEFVAPYVVSPRDDVDRLLALGDVAAGDYLIDLGSGDGRIVITAGLRGAMGHGVELDPELVALARDNARGAEVGNRVTFRRGDIFDADLTHASVVTLYLMPEVNLRLRSKLLDELQPGARVLSLSFDMGDWRPDRRVDARTSGGIMMWIVPAHVDGRWALTMGGERFELHVEQRFQEIEAHLSRNGDRLHVLEASLRGRRLGLLAGDGRDRYAFSGRVDGGMMSGLVQIHGIDGSRVTTWTAQPLAPAGPGG